MCVNSTGVLILQSLLQITTEPLCQYYSSVISSTFLSGVNMLNTHTEQNVRDTLFVKAQLDLTHFDQLKAEQ